MSNAAGEVNSESLLGQGIAAAKDGRKQQAISIFIKLVGQDKGNLEAWLWLARLLDDPAARRKCLQIVQQLDPANPDARFLLAELDRPPAVPQTLPPEPADSQPQPARSPISADRTVNHGEGNTSNAAGEVNGEFLLGQGIAAAKAGRKQQAITIFIKLVGQNKGNLEAWLWLARLLDDPAGRRKCLQIVQQLDPANLEARFLLGELDRPPAVPPTPPPEPAVRRPEPARPPIAAPARRAARTKPAYKILAFCLAGITGLACLAVVAVAIWWGYQQSQMASSVPGLVIATSTPAYSPDGLKNIYVEYILDASNSMNDMLPDGISKAAAAKKDLATRLTSYNPDESVGLRVFGENVPASNQKQSCQDIQLVAPVAPGEMGQIVSWLAGYRPQGTRPIAAALQQAASDFVVGEDRVNSIVLISDGQETCGGDPCALVKQLEGQGLRFSLYVIGLNVDEDTRQQLSCIAQVGGGLYQDAQTSQELKDDLDRVQQLILLQARATPVPANPVVLLPTGLPTATPILTATELPGTPTSSEEQLDSILIDEPNVFLTFDRNIWTAEAVNQQNILELKADPSCSIQEPPAIDIGDGDSDYQWKTSQEEIGGYSFEIKSIFYKGTIFMILYDDYQDNMGDVNIEVGTSLICQAAAREVLKLSAANQFGPIKP